MRDGHQSQLIACKRRTVVDGMDERRLARDNELSLVNLLGGLEASPAIIAHRHISLCHFTDNSTGSRDWVERPSRETRFERRHGHSQ